VRVAVVAEWYPSQADPVLGIWAHRQAVAAREHGVEVRVLAMRRPVPPLSVVRRLAAMPPDIGALRRWGRAARSSLRPLTLDGLGVTPVPFLAPPRPISYGSWGWWMSPPLHRALDRLYASWRFDLVHAHCLAPAGHAVARWVAGRGLAMRPALVVSAHGPDMIHVPERSSVGRHACVATLRGADLVVANSIWARRRCEEIAGRPLPARVVHLGADPVPVAGRPESSVNGSVRMVTVAHLVARKRHETVLRAMSLLEPERRPEYVVIGDGPCREPLERLARELGVSDRVRFLGQLPNPEAVACAAACDLFVMPGVEEPFGVAFVEAMAAGVPAIGGRGEGGPEDIAAAGDGMVLVTPGDAVGLAREIDRLVVDRHELRRLGAAARETIAANFTWARCGEQTVAAYRSAVARHPATDR
jgi:teichuronic acid biosynthesis glycosyltransferase TuaC